MKWLNLYLVNYFNIGALTFQNKYYPVIIEAEKYFPKV